MFLSPPTTILLVVFAWHVVIGWRLFTLTGFHQQRGSPREQKREPAQLPLEARD